MSTNSDEETTGDPDNTVGAENVSFQQLFKVATASFCVIDVLLDCELQEQAENTVDGACSTLFIANLGPNCTEDELKPVLSQ